MNKQKIWAIGTLASFAYQKPIMMLTSMDRLNPRLYDLFFIWGLFLFWDVLSKPIDNAVLKIWRKMIILMTVCCAVYAVLIPPATYAFSLYYLFKYIEGFLVIKMLFNCREFLTADLIEKVLIAGGVFVTLYCIPQALHAEVVEVEIAPGRYMALPPGMFIGPFMSYFALSQYSVIAAIVALSRYVRTEGHKLLNLGLTLFVAYPAFSCGSRTGLFLLLFSCVFFLIISNHKKEVLLLTAVLVAGIVFLSNRQGVDPLSYLTENNNTFVRLMEQEDDETLSVRGRFSFFELFEFTNYDYWFLMPFVGSGFYVSPILGHYRVGYGFHNNYVFAFEQLGLFGLFLFLSLLFSTFKTTYRLKTNNYFSIPICALVFAYLIVNFSGQSFWQGFGNGEMNTLIIYMMSISISEEFKTNN